MHSLTSTTSTPAVALTGEFSHLRPWATFPTALRTELRSSFGLTDSQVLWLGKSLVSIADHIRHKPTATAVFDELDRLRKELTIARDKPPRRSASVARAQKRLGRWQSSARLVAGLDGPREAMGHVGMAWAEMQVDAPVVVEPSGDQPMFAALVDVIALRLAGGGTTSEDTAAAPETETLIAFAVAVIDRAVADRPTQQRRSVASARAIQCIVDALRRPEDNVSMQVAKSLIPTWADAATDGTSPPREGSFGALAKLVFQQVTQDTAASPGSSIRKYMEGIPDPRPVGRPSSTG